MRGYFFILVRLFSASFVRALARIVRAANAIDRTIRRLVVRVLNILVRARCVSSASRRVVYKERTRRGTTSARAFFVRRDAFSATRCGNNLIQLQVCTRAKKQHDTVRCRYRTVR